MRHMKKPCRGATGRASDTSLLGSVDDHHDSPKIHEYQATVIARRARVSAATARTIARLAFEDRRAWR